VDLEAAELHRFRNNAGLDGDPSHGLQRAKSMGAAEVYRYLLTMNEEDLNDDQMETGGQQDHGANGQG
jgi:hypothetical protein